MVVDNLHVPGLAVTPNQANPPSIVDANTVLSAAVTFQCLQAIAGRHPQVVEDACGIHHLQFCLGPPLDIRREVPDGATRKEGGCPLIGKGSNHSDSVPRNGTRVNERTKLQFILLPIL